MNDTKHLIAASLTLDSYEGIMNESQRAKNGLKFNERPNLLELRLDYMPVDKLHFKTIEMLVKGIHNIPLIVTIRHQNEAGNDPSAGYKGEEEKRIELLQYSADMGASHIDIEFKYFKPLRVNPDKTKLIISHHDFNRTPEYSELEQIYKEMASLGKDKIIKIATMSRGEHDNQNIMRLVKKYSHEQPLIAIGMSPLGLETRVYSLIHGAYLTYAFLKGSKSAAPGQVSVGELRKMIQTVETR